QLLTHRAAVVVIRLSGSVGGHLEIDLALVQVNPRHLHTDRVTQPIDAAGALAHPAVVPLVGVVVIGRPGSDVHQALDVDVGQPHGPTEPRTCGGEATEV